MHVDLVSKEVHDLTINLIVCGDKVSCPMPFTRDNICLNGERYQDKDIAVNIPLPFLDYHH